jgi:hypothetical protein
MCDAFNLIAASINKDRQRAKAIIRGCDLADVLGATVNMLSAVIQGAGEREADELASIGQRLAA